MIMILWYLDIVFIVIQVKTFVYSREYKLHDELDEFFRNFCEQTIVKINKILGLVKNKRLTKAITND
jgi:hypothetical protein